VFNVLLQVLDDGRLTDGQGRTVDFRNAVIVMTSNLGSQLIQDMLGKDKAGIDYASIKEAVMTVVGTHFRPEFINRIDEAVVFSPLGSTQIRSIARVQSQRVVQRLKERNIALEFSDAALDLLAHSGYDPIFGARPLKRAIQAHVENPLARMILDGQFAAGDRVQVEANEGALSFTRA
jgi:ATP-dependent Clp protease ATP-binding subunit ClpB